MNDSSQQSDEAQLARLDHFKRQQWPSPALGPQLLEFFKNSVAKRQKRFGEIADCWAKLVPPLFHDHCALDGYLRGTLTVLVDSSSHLYELKQLLLAGLEKQLFMGCAKAGLRKIVLKPGRWYRGEADEKKLEF